AAVIAPSVSSHCSKRPKPIPATRSKTPAQRSCSSSRSMRYGRSPRSSSSRIAPVASTAHGGPHDAASSVSEPPTSGPSTARPLRARAHGRQPFGARQDLGERAELVVGERALEHRAVEAAEPGESALPEQERRHVAVADEWLARGARGHGVESIDDAVAAPAA